MSSPAPSSPRVLQPRRIEACRASGSTDLVDFLHFPALPVAGTYVTPGGEGQEALLPLTLAYCPDSALVQLREIFPPEIYANYRFVGTGSTSYTAHLEWCAADLMDRHGVRGKRVLELGCSNGRLLGLLRDRGDNAVFGYEPSTELQRECERAGIPSTNSFFSTSTLDRIPALPVDAVVVRHVMEHIDDPNDFVAAIGRVLAPEGVAIIEVPDLRSILDRKLYAHFYHEHVAYYSPESLARLFARHGFEVVEHRVVDIHGGSLYAAFRRAAGPAGPVAADGITLETCRAFAGELTRYFATLRDFFEAQRAAGVRIAGYGAAHRTTVMCSLARLGTEHVAYLVDRNPHLHGLKTPQAHLPISPPARLAQEPTDAVALFASSFEREILEEQRAFAERGGRFISLLPTPRYLD
jgi:SAM-dependent methyltransferase